MVGKSQEGSIASSVSRRKSVGVDIDQGIDKTVKVKRSARLSLGMMLQKSSRVSPVKSLDPSPNSVVDVAIRKSARLSAKAPHKVDAEPASLRPTNVNAKSSIPKRRASMSVVDSVKGTSVKENVIPIVEVVLVPKEGVKKRRASLLEVQNKINAVMDQLEPPSPVSKERSDGRRKSLRISLLAPAVNSTSKTASGEVVWLDI
jgi:hypothetical protein